MKSSRCLSRLRPDPCVKKLATVMRLVPVRALLATLPLGRVDATLEVCKRAELGAARGGINNRLRERGLGALL